MRSGAVYERATWEPAIGESAASSLQLLPTPSSLESQPTEEYIEECRAAGIDPSKRLYLPGRKWHSQRTLSRIAPMIPTPTASANGMSRNRTSGRSNPDSKHHDGVTLADWVRLLPTPAAADGSGGKQHRIGSISSTGVRIEDGTKVQVSLRDALNMLPTPAARDGKGPDLPSRQGGESLPTVVDRLLPTPRATRGGSGTETMVALGAERSDEERPQGNMVLLPTPNAADSERGPDYARMGREESGGDDLVTTAARAAKGRLRTGQPSAPQSSDGSPSSAEEHQPRLW